MVIFIIVAVVALAVGFCGTVALTTALLALFQPKTRADTVLCFVKAPFKGVYDGYHQDP